jgi:hypothetical protein
MKLRRNEFCPIHRSLSCCGRESIKKAPRLKQIGVRRVETRIMLEVIENSAQTRK